MHVLHFDEFSSYHLHWTIVLPMYEGIIFSVLYALSSWNEIQLTDTYTRFLNPHYISALTISVQTTVVTAEVTFIYSDSESVRQYEAYVTSLTSTQRCSRRGDEPPFRCLLRGLQEATEYAILTRVCLLGKPTCEPPITKTVRTELRGSYNFHYLPINTA